MSANNHEGPSGILCAVSRQAGAVSDIITLFIFIIILKPSIRELGIYWSDIKKSTKILYLTGGSLVLLLVIS